MAFETSDVMNKTDIANYSAKETLRSGQLVTIRAIHGGDKGGVTDVLRELSSESFYRRTFAPKRDLTDRELSQLTDVDFVNVVALVALMKEEDEDRIVGGGRYVRSGDTRAEVAFLIDDAHQGLGIGSRIFKHLVLLAQASGMKQFEAEVLPTNDAMLRLFTRSGFPVTTSRSRDAVHVTIELLAAGQNTEGGTS